VGLLSGGRFALGLGAGENLNEHVVGRGWQPANIRHEMLTEAVEIITALFGGDYVNYRGTHFSVDSAKLWDVGTRPLIGIAVSGEQSCALAGRYADAMIAVEPDADLGTLFDAMGGTGKRRIGQVPISWDADRQVAIDRAHEQFRWFGGGWKVNAEIPGTAGFAAASQFVRKGDIADAISCGPDIGEHVKAVGKFIDAGFTDVAVVQIGGDTQPAFLDWAERELLPALRAH
jgi:G6PDH family F420-dependent oxidoreductase